MFDEIKFILIYFYIIVITFILFLQILFLKNR
jgi:hypothetical protein